MGQALITTDAPGCRGVVDKGQMLALPAAQRSAMGLRGRQKMEREFDEQIVIGRYLAAIALAQSRLW